MCSTPITSSCRAARALVHRCGLPGPPAACAKPISLSDWSLPITWSSAHQLDTVIHASKCAIQRSMHSFSLYKLSLTFCARIWRMIVSRKCCTYDRNAYGRKTGRYFLGIAIQLCIYVDSADDSLYRHAARRWCHAFARSLCMNSTPQNQDQNHTLQNFKRYFNDIFLNHSLTINNGFVPLWMNFYLS